jgi:hypothetical protein
MEGCPGAIFEGGLQAGESGCGSIDCEKPGTTVEARSDEEGAHGPLDFCMGLLAGFAPCGPHEFCVDGRGKLQNSKGQVLLDFFGELSTFLPLRSATIASA